MSHIKTGNQNQTLQLLEGLVTCTCDNCEPNRTIGSDPYAYELCICFSYYRLGLQFF
jgi:hypothetical protein